jgi:hypothetical protein
LVFYLFFSRKYIFQAPDTYRNHHIWWFVVRDYGLLRGSVTVRVRVRVRVLEGI